VHGALLAAALVATYWFAFLYAPFDPLSTFLLGTIFALPMTYLWLRRDLETAIGFHFCTDFVRFVAAIPHNLRGPANILKQNETVTDSCW
jgi:membrane protease YdiL (CAAX protease family)